MLPEPPQGARVLRPRPLEDHALAARDAAVGPRHPLEPRDLALDRAEPHRLARREPPAADALAGPAAPAVAVRRAAAVTAVSRGRRGDGGG